MTKMTEARRAIARSLTPQDADARQRKAATDQATALLDAALTEAFTAARWHEHVAALLRREIRVHRGIGLLADTVRSLGRPGKVAAR